VAAKLNLLDTVAWVDGELQGYTCRWEELPLYRKVHGELKAYNPYHGLIPFHLEDRESADVFTRAPIAASVGNLEEMVVAARNGATFQYRLSHSMKRALMEGMDFPMEPVLLTNSATFRHVLESVNGLALDWAIAMERSGVDGSGWSLKVEDTEKTKHAEYTVFAHTVGIVGGAEGSSHQNVKQRVNHREKIARSEITNFVTQARAAIDTLPAELQASTSKQLAVIEDAASPEERLSALRSLRNTMEGAAGNLTAQGIIGLIGALLP
jgi:hypothetical protein